MIQVTFERRQADKTIAAFTIEGHAQYARAGKDIVCAGVSAISVGTVNSIEALTGVVLPASMKNGWLSSDVPETGSPETDAQVQLLLESMRVMLETIQQSYGRFVVIHEQSR